MTACKSDASLDDLFQPNAKLDDRSAYASISASSSHVNQGNAFVTNSGKTDLATQLHIVYQVNYEVRLYV